MEKLPIETRLEGIIITNDDGEIQTVNREFTKITGYTSEEVLGHNPRILKSSRHSEDFYKNLWDSIINEGYWHGLIWNKRKNGEIYLECLEINRIKCMEGKQYYIATLKDVSDCEAKDDPCNHGIADCESRSSSPKITKADLLDALYNEEFELHYQPLINITNQQIYGIEALLRWQHPTYGTITPMEFIPLAEKTGLIVPITEWLMEKALIELKMLHKLGFNELKLFINISVSHFNHSNFVELIRFLLNKTGVDPNLLELEITENIFLEPTDKAINKINEIKKLGVRMSIDDFGTGYSSLLYLKYFPFDSIKIDRAFIKDIGKGQANNIIVELIIKMGKSLNLCVIAEGVETEEQARFLKANNCDVLQGYLFSRPVLFYQLFNILSGNNLTNVT